MTKSYRELFIWQRAVDLAVLIATTTETFSSRQRWILVAQMQRSANSVPSNIAEGKGRLSPKELRQFLAIARGSLYELATQVEIARRLNLLDDEAFQSIDQMMAQISTGISRLIYRLKT